MPVSVSSFFTYYDSRIRDRCDAHIYPLLVSSSFHQPNFAPCATEQGEPAICYRSPQGSIAGWDIRQSWAQITRPRKPRLINGLSPVNGDPESYVLPRMSRRVGRPSPSNQKTFFFRPCHAFQGENGSGGASFFFFFYYKLSSPDFLGPVFSNEVAI